MTTPNNNLEIMACPFCGNTPAEPAPHFFDGASLWTIVCHTCGAFGPHSQSATGAIRFWNAAYRLPKKSERQKP